MCGNKQKPNQACLLSGHTKEYFREKEESTDFLFLADHKLMRVPCHYLYLMKCVGLTQTHRKRLGLISKSEQMQDFLSFLFFFFYFFNVYLFWDRETEHEWGRVRERETQNLKQAPGSELSAQSLAWGSNSWTARSWPEPKSDAPLTEPPRCPKTFIFLTARTFLVSQVILIAV